MPFEFSYGCNPNGGGGDEGNIHETFFELHELTKDVSGFVKLLAVDGDEDQKETAYVTSYAYSISPAYPLGIWSINSSLSEGVTLHASSIAGFFPIEFVHYLDNGQSIFADFWHEVPMGSEIVEFRPSTLRTFTYSLTVTATTSSGAVYSITLDMTVEHDWTPGKLKLLEYVDAIRSSEG